MDEQRRLILDQFTRQAVPFSEMHARDDAEIHRLLIDTAGIGPEDEVLDVACGPGLVACEVAKVARHVTGVDLTRAMIEQAEARQRSLGLTNLTWAVGDAQPLAFPDASFSRVITRYTFHHFTDPAGVFAEMVRVCRPGGRVTVCDVFTTSPEQGEAYDRLERLPRPVPHPCPATGRAGRPVRRAEGRAAGVLQVPGRRSRTCCRGPFPDPGGADAFRRTVDADVGVNRLGIDACERAACASPSRS